MVSEVGGDAQAAATELPAIFLGSPTLLGGNPIESIREQLDRGLVDDAGSTEIEGRPVRKLVEESGIFEYYVDAETFEPVRVRMLMGWRDPEADSPSERLAYDVDFEEFETMPLDDQTDDLLEVQTQPDPTVVETDPPTN